MNVYDLYEQANTNLSSRKSGWEDDN